MIFLNGDRDVLRCAMQSCSSRTIKLMAARACATRRCLNIIAMHSNISKTCQEEKSETFRHTSFQTNIANIDSVGWRELTISQLTIFAHMRHGTYCPSLQHKNAMRFRDFRVKKLSMKSALLLHPQCETASDHASRSQFFFSID